MVGSVLVATPGSVHSTFIELQLHIIPQHHIHIPPRPLLFRRYKPTKTVASRAPSNVRLYWPLDLLASSYPLRYGFCLHHGM